MALQMEWALSPPSHWEVVLSLLPRLFLHSDEQHRVLLLRQKPSDKYRWAALPWSDLILLSFRTALGVSVRLLSQLLLLCYDCVITVLTSVRQVAELHWMSRGIGLNGQIKQNIRCPFFWSDVTWWMSHMVVMFLVCGQRRLKGGQYKETFLQWPVKTWHIKS